MTGVEPANDGVTIHCRNHLATPAIIFILPCYNYTIFYFFGLLKILFKFMQNYLTIFINGEPFNCDSRMSLNDILIYLSININLVIIEYNYSIIQKKDFSNLYLKDNDVIEVISIVGGG